MKPKCSQRVGLVALAHPTGRLGSCPTRIYRISAGAIPSEKRKVAGSIPALATIYLCRSRHILLDDSATISAFPNDYMGPHEAKFGPIEGRFWPHFARTFPLNGL